MYQLREKEMTYVLPFLVAQMVASNCNAGDLGLIPGLGRFPREGMATHSSILTC